MIEKKKRSVFIKIIFFLLIILILYLLWFFSFNIKTIKSGRGVDFNNIVYNNYESEDNEVYLDVVNEEKIKIRYMINKKDNIVYNGVLDYKYEEGYLYTEEIIDDEENYILEFLIIDENTIYFHTKNKYLYLND